MKAITKEVKIAIAAILGIIILFFGLQFLKGLNIFSNTDSYTILFNNINGLSPSTPIYADGYKVGHVGDISYDYEKGQTIYVEAEIDKNLRIPKGTTAEIESDLMGNSRVNLLMANNPREAVKPGETIDGRLYSGALDKVSAMVPSIEAMMPKIDSILTSINALLANPALAQSLANMQNVTAELNNTARQATQLVAALNATVPQLTNKADGILGKADATMGNTKALTGNLAKIDVAPTIELVNTTLASTQEAMAKLNTSMSDINKLTTNLNSNTGTLGLLMNDDHLYTNLNRTVSSADSLLTDLKSHPKRYVHFSIFGKKDK